VHRRRAVDGDDDRCPGGTFDKEEQMAGEELLKDHIEKLSGGDLDGAIAVYKDDAVLHYPGQGPLSRDYRGREEIKSFFTQVGELTEGTFRASYEAIFADNQYEAALASLNAERKGERHEWKAMELVRIENGQIAHHQIFEDDQHALDRWWGL
jgi:ketosteroid isomerase-like protein